VIGQAGVHEEVEASSAIFMGDDFGEFVGDAFGGNFGEKGGVFFEGGVGGGFDVEARFEGEADGAEESEGVFLKAFGGVADGADEFVVEVGLAVDEVDDVLEGMYIVVVFDFDEDDAEVGADAVGVREEGLDLCGGGGGCEVVVFGLLSEELIADTAACEVGGVTCLTEDLGD